MPSFINIMFHFLLLQFNISCIQRDEQDGRESSQHACVLDHEEGEVRFPSSYFFSQHVVHLWELEDTLLNSCRHLVVKQRSCAFISVVSELWIRSGYGEILALWGIRS